MTAKEALKILYEPDRIGVTIIKANTPDVAKYNNDSMAALQMAIEALEKQIPKKPKRVGYFLVCPICYGRNGLFDDNYVVTKQIGHDENISHCLVCGQAIDWESE